MNFIKIIILVVLVLIVIIGIFCVYDLYKYNYQENISKCTLNKKFYSINEVNNNLNSIYEYNHNKFQNEVLNLDERWKDWPETELYDLSNTSNGKGSWKIYPIYGFGMFVNSAKEQTPEIFKFVKRLYDDIGDELKLVSISKMSPKMKLNPLQGWGSHSNNVIRCHYGIIVPENSCYISVSDNFKLKNEVKKFHSEKEWLIFDDSKVHYAENGSDEDRIVLIIDVQRPNLIKKGESQIGDTKELIEFINEMMKENNNNKIK